MNWGSTRRRCRRDSSARTAWWWQTALTLGTGDSKIKTCDTEFFFKKNVFPNIAPRQDLNLWPSFYLRAQPPWRGNTFSFKIRFTDMPSAGLRTQILKYLGILRKCRYTSEENDKRRRTCYAYVIFMEYLWKIKYLFRHLLLIIPKFPVFERFLIWMR